MPPISKPTVADGRDPLDRLVANLTVYAAESVPGQARVAIQALRQAQQQVLPPGINPVGMQVSATRLRQAAVRVDADERSALVTVAAWLERLAHG